MRLRDLRWYMLAAVVLLVSYAAVAFCFYLSIRSGKVENSMKELGLEVAESQNTIVNEKINYYYDLYIKDVSNELVYDYRASHDNTKVFERLGNHQQSLKSKFSGLDVAVVYEEAWTFEPTVVEQGVPVRDTNYYFYFGKQVTDTEYLVTRISAVNFFSFIKDQMVVFNSEGIITYENIEGIQTGSSVASSDMFGTNYKDDINENGVLSNVYSLSINRSAVSAIKNDRLGGYFTVIIPAKIPAADPAKAAKPLRVTPATSQTMTAVSRQTAPKISQLAGQPRKASGMTAFQITMQLNRKLNRALAPVQPPKTQSSTQNPAKSASPQPMR